MYVWVYSGLSYAGADAGLRKGGVKCCKNSIGVKNYFRRAETIEDIFQTKIYISGGFFWNCRGTKVPYCPYIASYQLPSDMFTHTFLLGFSGF